MAETNILDDALIRLLVARDGRLTVAVLNDGSEAVFSNIAWGYDLGDQYAHITTNISPNVEGLEVDFFFTNELRDLRDFEWRHSLFCFPI